MKTRVLSTGLLAITLFALPGIFIFNQLAGAGFLYEPVLITTIGQNPEGLIVRVVLQRNGIDFAYLPLAARDDLSDYNSLIMAVGLSRKGLRAARTTFQSELIRAVQLMEGSLEGELPVVLVHLGGSARRDEESNELLAVTVPNSSYLIVSDESDYDRYFSRLSVSRGLPLEIIKDLSTLRESFALMLPDSGQDGD